MFLAMIRTQLEGRCYMLRNEKNTSSEQYYLYITECLAQSQARGCEVAQRADQSRPLATLTKTYEVVAQRILSCLFQT